MSDDQLSWANLFGNSEATEKESQKENSPDAATLTPQPPSLPPRPRRQEPAKTESVRPKYSEQDWTSLEVKKLAAETVSSETASPQPASQEPLSSLVDKEPIAKSATAERLIASAKAQSNSGQAAVQVERGSPAVAPFETLFEPPFEPPFGVEPKSEPKPASKFESKFESKVEPKPKADIQLAAAETNFVTTSKTTSATIFESATKNTVAPEPTALSVSQLNKAIKGLLEGEFPLVWLKAEISNFKPHTSGHFYFSLKDSKAQISAVMFRGFNSQLKFRPEDGMEVLVRGRVTVYEPRGNYQIFCEVMEPVGAGALQKAFEQLKSKLQKEGLFEASRKRPLPALPRHIGIVTSPTGAAIRDMLNVLGRRFKGARITLVAAKVQGDQAPGEIIAAIQLINRLTDLDVLIVGRGGGSIEDLWAFNDEGVVRAIAASKVPVISAVGHEIDFTIADFVADLRAPTPSAAAELVVKNAADLQSRVIEMQRSLQLSMQRRLKNSLQTTHHLTQRLVDPQRRLQDASIRCDELMQRLENATFRYMQDSRLQIELLFRKLGSPDQRVRNEKQKVAALQSRLQSGARHQLMRKRESMEKNMALLDSLSPLKVVERGYSLVTKDSEIIKDASRLKAG